MRLLDTLLDRLPATTVHAHCDLPCGVYDPAQARVDATSVYTTTKKYLEAEGNAVFQTRALVIKEELAEQVKHHLWVLWTDYFKPNHLEQYPQLHDLFWKATKAAGATKQTTTLEAAQALLDAVDEVGALFAQTKPGYDYEAVRKNGELQIQR